MSADRVMFVTGATGLIGSHVAERALTLGYVVRALVRPGREAVLATLARGREIVPVHGELADRDALRRGLDGAHVVVHCAAAVGDSGSAAHYRAINVDQLKGLLELSANASLDRFVMMSSLGVYEARDHHGTDETTAIVVRGFDPYTQTKADAERACTAAIQSGLPATILRPGFTYGPRDRHVLPALSRALARRRLVFIGKGDQLLDHTSVHNLVEAVFLAIGCEAARGETFNVTDKHLATRREFINAAAAALAMPAPERALPRTFAYGLAWAMDRGARFFGMAEAPLFSLARYKFLALNLNYSIAKAERVLGYAPKVEYREGLLEAAAWWRADAQSGAVQLGAS